MVVLTEPVEAQEAVVSEGFLTEAAGVVVPV